MSSRSVFSLDPRVRPYFQWLLEVGHALGLEPRVTSARRSREEQAELYQRYKAGKSRFPAARPGSSLHEHGLALDLVSRDNELLSRYWKHYLGGFWSPKDAVHYDVRPWLS